MRVYNLQVFDDTISGTSTTWYSNGDFNRSLGAADELALAAHVASVSGTSPTLTVQVEHCADGVSWRSTPSAEISAGALTNDVVLVGMRTTATVLLPFVRMKITLGGTTPACRLKLYVTGRARGKAAYASES
jgi:hypothetical protein